MSEYRIVESVGSRIENVHSYEDLEIHHSSRHGREPGRAYADVDGEREEVLRTRSGTGQLMVSKDFILLDKRTGSGSVPVPAPVSGYITMDRSDGLVRIYDQPGGELIAQVRHMDLRRSGLQDGDYIRYGQPMGIQGGFNNDNPNAFGTHVHVDVNARYLAQFKQYIRDVDTGVIATDRYPNQDNNRTTPAPRAAALADGVLRQGEQGPEVTRLQEQLNTQGYRDAQGRVLATEGNFGLRTKQAVQSLQRARGLDDDGIVGPDTFGALRNAPATTRVPNPAPAAPTPQLTDSRTALSDLIGRGEGGYNSYNRGRAGDSGGREIDFSQMPLAEIMRRQDLPRNDPNRLFAVGKFQMIPGTMEETVSAMRLDRNLRFTPELQERMFADYLIDEKRPVVHAYITGRTGGAEGLRRAQIALAQEFASVADPRTGRSVYDGDSGGNSASIAAREVETALNQMRTQYKANIDQGMSPDAAYKALGGVSQNQNQPRNTTSQDSNGAPRPTRAGVDAMIVPGGKGAEILNLQQRLNKLGYHDAQGRSLAADSDFGPSTKQAVQAFQQAHGLKTDGVVGPKTIEALKKAEQTPLLSSPYHPDHALYKQSYDEIKKLDPKRLGFNNDREFKNAAAALAFDAKVSGLKQIDHVVLSTNGTGLFAVQGRLDDPVHRRIHVGKAQAASQPVEKSTLQMDQERQTQQQQTSEREPHRMLLA